MERLSRRLRITAPAFTVRTAPRDVQCVRFRAQVCVDGQVAFSYTYRLNTDLTLHAVGRERRMHSVRRFARLFGWRRMSVHEAAVLLRVFLQANAKRLTAMASAEHVDAAARAGQLHRISNALATEHALSIRRRVHGIHRARLLAFELLEEAGERASYHWTQAGPPVDGVLPDLSAILDDPVRQAG